MRSSGKDYLYLQNETDTETDTKTQGNQMWVLEPTPYPLYVPDHLSFPHSRIRLNNTEGKDTQKKKLKIQI